MGRIKDTQLRAAETLLDRGVRLRLPAPAFFRWVRADRLRIKPLRAGTILEFSRIVNAYGLEELQAKGFKALEKQIEPCARCIAISLLNRRWSINCLSGWLTKRLLWKYKAADLIRAYLIVAGMSSAADFTIITKFYCQMMKTMMMPNLGQKSGS